MKAAPWIITCLALLGCGLLWRALDKCGDTTVQRSPYQDSLQWSRDSVAVINARLVERDSSIARIERERDSAQVSRPSPEQSHRNNVAHFDRVGVNAAIDTLNLPPIGR